MTKYYDKPFAVDGNKVEIPDLSTGGNVAYGSGYGPDYDLPEGDPNRKRIGRTPYNGVMFDATQNLKQWQDHLYPKFAPTKTGGYSKGQTVEFNDKYYQSNVDGNTATPPGNNWVLISITPNASVDSKQWQTVALGADPLHDIDFSAGRVSDSTGVAILESIALTKRIDAAWSAGSGSGGLFSGAVSASNTYHLFLIQKDSDGSVDAGFDVSPIAANIPAGYTAFRRIASIMTDGSSNIIPFYQQGDYFGLVNPKNILSASSVSQVVYTNIPTGLPTGLLTLKASLSALIYDTAGFQFWLRLAPTTDIAPDPASLQGNYCQLSIITGGSSSNAVLDIAMGVSSNVRIRAINQSATRLTTINTIGWIDDRS